MDSTFLIKSSLSLFQLQLTCEVCQTKSHAKEAGLFYLTVIFDDHQFAPVENPNTQANKRARMDALKDLCTNNQDLFLYVKIPDDTNPNPLTKYKFVSPYNSPYIINTFKCLLFRKTAQFHKVPHDTITIPMVAFICTLVIGSLLRCAYQFG